MKESVKIEGAVVDKVRRHIKKTKQTIGGFFEVCVGQSLTPTYNVLDNSRAFRDYLDKNNIQYRGNGHFTTLINISDPITVGMEWGIYKALNSPQYEKQRIKE